jgi:hypothetical protein
MRPMRNEPPVIRASYAPDVDEREEAWGRLHEAIPARWHVGLPSFDPGRPGWSISAVGPHPGRGKLPVYVTGFGDDELSAIRDLDGRLRGERGDGPRKLDELRTRLRLAYLRGAEEWTRADAGQGLTDEQLVRVLRQFPGA